MARDKSRKRGAVPPGPRRGAAGGRRLRPLLEPLEGRALPASVVVGAIVAENQLPGTPPSQWDIARGGDTTIQGFTTDISVEHGQTVSFKINDPAKAPYHIEIYRMGYYQGNGARLVATVASSQTLDQAQPKPLTDAATGLVDAGNWAVSASWAVPAAATSGIYFADIRRDDTGGTSQAFFVVRQDEGPSDVLFQTSDSTWQAYNSWGGNSLYGGSGPSPTGAAYMVSYNRPLVVDADSGGLGDYNSPWHAEYPMVRWMEMNGYDVSYSTDVDTARNGPLLLNHKAFLSVGHDEYWSAQQRANVTAARDAGVNLAFFSGNEDFWKTRWQAGTDASGTPYRTLVCYKESKNGRIDPRDAAPTWEWTGTWRDANGGAPADGGAPENALSGTAYMADRTSVDLGVSLNVPAADANLRFWRDTSVARLQPGQVATLGQFIVGYETDMDVDNGSRPAGLLDMSSTTFSTASAVVDQSGTRVGPGTSTHSTTLYRAPGGALVFGAGTVQWSWGLDGHHNESPSAPDPAIQQATINLLADMNVSPASIQPGMTRATPSTDAVAPTSRVASPAGGAAIAVGSPVTIGGTATDVGGVVAGVEASTDGGQTWHPAVGRSSWSYTWVPDAPGPVKIESRAVDDSGNLEAPSAGVTVSVSYPPTSTAGLVASYSFDEGTGTVVHDLSGSGNNGTVANATWAQGLFGQALSFNGANSWVTINDSPSLHLTAGMTLEAWAWPTAPASGRSALMVKERAGGLAYSLDAADGANQPPASYVDIANTDYDSKGGPGLPLNTWSFLTGTYDGSNLRLYVNGQLVNTLGASGPITTSAGPLRIGGDALLGEYFQGLIDDIRVYNRPLNQGEIRSDMNTPAGSTQADNIPPTGSITSPAANSSASGVATVSATASDNVSVAGVQFQLNGANLGPRVTVAPYSFAWDTRTVADGTYTISAVVGDLAGNTTQLVGLNVTVNNPADTAPPTVRLTSPTGSNPLIAGTIVPSAFASDNVGVVGVQFQLDGNNIGPALTASPYRFAWDTTAVADGPHSLTAVARDAAGNRATSAPFALTVDNTAPTVTAETPAPGATAISTSAPGIAFTLSEPVQPATLGVVLKGPAGNTIQGAVSYNTPSNTATFTPAGALEPSTRYTVTVGGAQDPAGNTMLPVSWSFTTTASVLNATIWGPSATPAVASAADTNPNELGVRFTSDVAGYVTAVRFYKGPSNTGVHTGHLWGPSGTPLGTATFAAETGTGWQQADFARPVAVAAGVAYTASYYAPAGGYAGDAGYFATAGVDAGVLHALADSAPGGDGVYAAGSDAFPASRYNAANYWVDVVFSNVLVPTVTATTPAPGSTGVGLSSPVVVTFDELMAVGSINTSTFHLRVDGTTADLPATVTYSGSTATLQPGAPLTGGTTYRVIVSGTITDAAGNPIGADTAWTFATGAGQWRQTTTGDFGPGTAAGTVVTDSTGGEVQLDGGFSDDFDGTALGAGWTVNSWAAAGGGPAAVTVTGGVLSMAGVEILSPATAAGAGVEGRINFGATPYQHFGLATDLGSLAGNDWAVFSTAGTSNTLFARVNVSGATQDVSLGALPAGFHVYRLTQASGAFRFFVDGTLQATIAAAVPGGTSLKVALSAFSGSPRPSLQADWVRVLAYPSGGTFVSATFDAGRAAAWGPVSWTAVVPAGTSLVIETSTSADGVNWTSWAAASSGGTVASPNGRYLRYRATLATTDATLTPALDDITFRWN